MFEAGLYEFLTTNNNGVSNLVGSGVYYSVVPKGASFPNIVIHTLLTNYDVDLISTSSLEERRVQINYISSVDQINAREGERAVETLLKDYSGTLSDGTLIQSTVVNSQFDLPYEVGGKSYAYGSALDISFWLVESTS